MKIKIFSFLFLLCLFKVSIYAQNKVLSFEGESLAEIFSQLEKETNYNFNYDPALLGAYTYTGEFSLTNVRASINKLLKQTPLEYEVSEQFILVFMSDPKVFRICGRLLDRREKYPLAYANIFVPELSKGGQSNIDGYFDFEIEAYKNQKIEISYVGYEPQEFLLGEISKADCPNIYLELSEGLFSNSVLVTDYIIDGITEGKENSSVEINYQKLSNWYTNIEQDVFKTIQLIPGITSIDESASNIQIRGSSADQNGILWEGGNIYGPGHLFGMISSVNPFSIEKVNVYKGVYAPNLSNRVGGIVDISLKDSIPDDFGGSIGTTLSEAHAQIELPLIKEKASIILAGRNTIEQVLNSPTLINYREKVFQDTKVDNTEEQSRQELDYNDLNAKFVFQPDPTLFGKASYFHSENKFSFNIPLLDDEFSTFDDVSFSSQASNFYLQKKWGTRFESSLSYSSSNYSYQYAFEFREIEDDINLEERLTSNNILDQNLSLQAKIFLPNGEVNLGYIWERNEVNYDIKVRHLFEESWSEGTGLSGVFHNIFMAYDYSKEKFQLNLGLRNIFYAASENWFLSPRLNLQAALSDHLKYKFSAGILHQFLTQVKDFRENELGLENQVWTLANEAEEIFSQKAQKIATGFVYQKNSWLIDAEFYYNRTLDISTFSRLIPTLGNAEEGFSYGNSDAYGIDLLMKKRWGLYSAWLNYSLSEVQFFFEDFREEAFPGTSDQRHNLSIINNFKWDNWNLGLSYQWRTGLPFTTSDGFRIEEEEDDFFYVINYPDINNQKLPDYHRIDLGLTYKHLLPDDKGAIEIALSLLNLWDRDNTFNKSFFLFGEEDEEDNEILEIEIGEVDKFLLPRTLLLLVRYSW